MKKWFFTHFLPGIFVGVFVTAFGFYLSGEKEKSANKPKALDKFVNISHNKVDKSEWEDKKMKLLYDGKEVSSFGDVKIQLYNFTGKNYSNVKVFIEIFQEDGDSMKLIKPDVYGINDLPEAVKQIKDSLIHSINSFKFGYTLEVLGQSTTPQTPVFTADFPIISNKQATVTITVQGDGLEAEPVDFDYQHYYSVNDSFWISDWLIWIYIIGGFTLIITVEIKVLSYFTSKRNKKFQKYLKTELANKINEQKLTLDAETIVKTYNKIEDTFDYENASDIKKWLTNMKEPAE